ncbi:MAG: DsrE family protein [Cyclobacteriaceae bacterium]|nr:DsrE family protein [Cyclobacteriaceae bacterium]
MKMYFLFFTFILSAGISTAQVQLFNAKTSYTPTSVGIVIYSNDVETVWNALRLANYSRTEGDTVCIFLLGKGVEVEKLVETNEDIKTQVDKLLDNGGEMLGCGTCLKIRNTDDPKVCKFSSMGDLYDLVRKNKVVLTF